MNAMGDRMIERQIDGLAVSEAGDGPTVLFLHGIGSSRRSFDAQLADLSQHFRCLAVDAPGYGNSDDPNPDPRTDPAVDDLMDWYAARYETLMPADRPCAVVGVSFGGVVAARIAMRNRRPLAAIVLADTSRGSGIDPDKADAMRSRPAELERVGARTFSDARAPRLVSPAAPDELVDRVASTMTDSIRLPGYAIAADAMAATDHTDRLAEVACPTLVLVGSADAVCPPAEAQRIANGIPGAELGVIDGAGHLANLERPAAFNAASASFLSTHLS